MVDLYQPVDENTPHSFIYMWLVLHVCWGNMILELAEKKLVLNNQNDYMQLSTVHVYVPNNNST